MRFRLLGLAFLRSCPAYFLVHAGSPKCFLEAIPEHIAITVKYGLRTPHQGVSCLVDIRRRNGLSVFSKEVTISQPRGNLVYSTQEAGRYEVCVSCPGGSWFQDQVYEWELSVDVSSISEGGRYADAGSKDDDTAAQGLERALARLEALEAQVEYERRMEADVLAWSEAALVWVQKLTVAQILITILCGAVTVPQLVKFFRSEKML
jgi:hypothetical protein